MDQIVAGCTYTMGKLKHPCGDRSYLGHLWKVESTNGTHALIRNVSPEPEFSNFGRDGLLVCIEEFDFTLATKEMIAWGRGVI